MSCSFARSNSSTARRSSSGRLYSEVHWSRHVAHERAARLRELGRHVHRRHARHHEQRLEAGRLVPEPLRDALPLPRAEQRVHGALDVARAAAVEHQHAGVAVLEGVEQVVRAAAEARRVVLVLEVAVDLAHHRERRLPVRGRAVEALRAPAVPDLVVVPRHVAREVGERAAEPALVPLRLVGGLVRAAQRGREYLAAGLGLPTRRRRTSGRRRRAGRRGRARRPWSKSVRHGRSGSAAVRPCCDFGRMSLQETTPKRNGPVVSGFGALQKPGVPSHAGRALAPSASRTSYV